MLTSAGLRGDAKRMAEVGFTAYLVKPVHQSQLIETLTTIWNTKEQNFPVRLITRHSLAETRSKDRVAKASDPLFNLLVLVVEDV